MKISFLTKQLFALLIIFSSSAYISAREYDVGNCRQGFLDRLSAGDCCLPFFNCDCFNGQIHAGIAPIVWTNRGCFQIVSCLIAGNTCELPTSGPVVGVFEMPKFSNFYHMPWTVGGKVAYSISECSEIYVEGNYRGASSTCFRVESNINVGTFIARTNFDFSQISSYGLYDVYIGVRTYGDLCGCLTGFLGIQVGIMHHKRVTASITTSSESNICAPPFTATCVELFPKHTAFAGGANLGFEWCLGCGLAIVLTGEIIATCGPNGNPNIPFNGCVADVVLPEVRPTNFVIGGIGTELLFPVTLGLKYSF